MNPSPLVTRLLGQLESVRRSGAAWVARCPAHDDQHASLSIGEGDDGRVLLKCFAGCSIETIVSTLGIQMRDLFPERGGIRSLSQRRATVQHLPGCTLEAYSKAKRIPVDFLREIGLADMTRLETPVVRIPYLDENGGEVAVRFRIAVEGKDKFRWRSGSKAKGMLYGLSRLAKARERGFVILVEGESCAQTLWLHGYPAVALPGAEMWVEDINASQLAGIDTVYVLVEGDRGGEAVIGWLKASSISERVGLIRLEDAKDVSELHLCGPERFVERLEAALHGATPWSEHERVEAELRRREAWKTCAKLAHEPRILDHLVSDARRLGVVGEERLVKVVYLAITSRLFRKIVSLAIKGPSSAGKNYLLGTVLRFLPEEDYYAHTGMSEKALVFGEEDLRHKCLVIYEAEGLEEGFHAYIVRSLLSEGRISYPITEKGADGRHRTRTVVREGPTGLLVTTTAILLHPENETRLLSLTVDDTAEQTRGILHSLADEAADETENGIDFEHWHALQRWLDGGINRVVIPFAHDLAALVPPAAVRLRRDFGAFLGLVKAHALLHQATRLCDAKGRIVATLDDYATVRELVSDLVAEGVGATASEASRQTVAVVEKLTAEKCEGVSIGAIADELGLDKSAASRRWRAARPYLRNLEEKRGLPARIVLGEQLPDELELLPTVERLRERCSVARGPDGSSTPPPLGEKERAILAECQELVDAGAATWVDWSCTGAAG